MSTRTRTEIDLPPPIAAYFTADTADANAVARCFSEDAVVIDERRTHQGRAAIARWSTETAEKYHYTSEPVSVDHSGGDTIVTARRTGEFPGSPVMLRYRFTVEKGAIVRLVITS